MQEEGALAWGSRMPYDLAEEDGFLGRAVFTEYSDVLLRLYGPRWGIMAELCGVHAGDRRNNLHQIGGGLSMVRELLQDGK